MNEKHQVRTAILVDGGFYRKRATSLFGKKSPVERAEELSQYCYAHLRDKYESRYLYRIFYYDCPPVDKNAFHPLLQKNINLGKRPEYDWTNDFFNELKHHRKFALRMGRISESQIYYNLKYETTKKLLNGSMTIVDLSENDFEINLEQKGVDMKIGVDISSLAFKQQVKDARILGEQEGRKAQQHEFEDVINKARNDGYRDAMTYLDDRATTARESGAREERARIANMGFFERRRYLNIHVA